MTITESKPNDLVHANKKEHVEPKPGAANAAAAGSGKS